MDKNRVGVEWNVIFFEFGISASDLRNSLIFYQLYYQFSSGRTFNMIHAGFLSENHSFYKIQLHPELYPSSNTRHHQETSYCIHITRPLLLPLRAPEGAGPVAPFAPGHAPFLARRIAPLHSVALIRDVSISQTQPAWYHAPLQLFCRVAPADPDNSWTDSKSASSR